MCFIEFGDLGCQSYDVKHSKNEKSNTKTSKNWINFDVSEVETLKTLSKVEYHFS